MTKYNDLYNPPAPASNITIRNIDSLVTARDVPMLLDTGSDITLLPVHFCEQIGAEVSKTKTLELIGFDESVSVARYVRLDLIFLKKLFRGNFLAYDHTEGIIGRDILNKFSIVLDGPNLEWDRVR